MGRKFDTEAVSFGEEGATERDAGDVVLPIHVSSTFATDGIDPDASLEGLDPGAGEFLYTRLSNPTRHAVEERLAALEGGEHGFAFASGTSAIAAAVLATVRPGDHVVAFDDLYGGTRAMFTEVLAGRLGIDVSFVDARNPAAVEDALRPETALIWLETPTNPLLKLCDVEAIAAIADDAGVTLGVDNTFASPYFQRPLDLGADLVAQSTTKFLNGHSDSLGGALITGDDDLAEEIEFLQTVGLGNVLSPFDAFLVLRGTKTLPMRMDRHEENALVLAQRLEEHDLVTAVHYPGLPSHPQHDLARRQMSGFGGVLSFELTGGLEAVEAFLDGLAEFSLAVSLGGVESLIEHPASMTHSTVPPEERDAIGISDSLLRVSVGVEHADDLLADVERGLERVSSTIEPPA